MIQAILYVNTTLGIIALLDRFVVNRVPVPGFSLTASLSEILDAWFARIECGRSNRPAGNRSRRLPVLY